MVFLLHLFLEDEVLFFVWLIPGLGFPPVDLLKIELLRVFIQHGILGIEARSPLASINKGRNGIRYPFVWRRLSGGTGDRIGPTRHHGHAFGGFVLGDVPDLAYPVCCQ